MSRQNRLKTYLRRLETTPHPDPFRPSSPSVFTCVHLQFSHISNRQPPRLDTAATRRKQTTATSSNSQLSALFCSAFHQPILSARPTSNLRSLVSDFCISNRSWYRLEFNISPTKQRTEALSNRSKSGVFYAPFRLAPLTSNSFASSASSASFASRPSHPFGVSYSPCNPSPRRGAA